MCYEWLDAPLERVAHQHAVEVVADDGVGCVRRFGAGFHRKPHRTVRAHAPPWAGDMLDP